LTPLRQWSGADLTVAVGCASAIPSARASATPDFRALASADASNSRHARGRERARQVPVKHRRILFAAAIASLASCTSSSSPYYYDPAYAYAPAAYDNAYYDAAMYGGYYYYPTYYYSNSINQQAAIASVVPPTVRLILLRWGVTIDPGCVTATPSVDADHDGIPANSTITFQCNSTPAAGGTAQVTGAVQIMDLNDTAADAGFALTFNGFLLHVVSASGAVTERTFDGMASVQKTASGIQSTQNFALDETDTFPDGVPRKSRLQMNGQGVLIPEGTAPVTKGTLTLSGTGTFTGPDGTVITLTRQTDPTLHWNNDCSNVANDQGFDSGAVLYKSSQGRQVRIVHDACDTATVTNTVVQ
jgi:hypothetical protein